ncbi:RNA exonuclease 1 [Reticulomyxa filosa]|uniref:RNA exonuclease 1 n=1 Tax=Reticulomyxa filosa TaxID=46433 RepID=X6N1E3_RETFI|nr:RNA exonuclease 1 [Reticulomyxa filosa]|eukprot:ETO19733.1 RNA exonuclease 1 [Reticulomyxa filosa]
MCISKRWSGITETHLEHVSKTVNDVYNDLSKWICQSTYIVGHGLENDLKALQVIHENVLDTSLLFPNGNKGKYKLKHLAFRYLKRNIQQHDHGHNPQEDALAALDLVQLRLQKGPNILQNTPDRFSIFSFLGHFQKKSMLIGPEHLVRIIRAGCKSRISCESNEAAFQACLQHLSQDAPENNAHLLWIYLQNEYKQSESTSSNALKSLADHLLQLYHAATENTAFVIVGGNKDLRKLKKLNHFHRHFQLQMFVVPFLK